MTVKLGVVMDPIETISAYKDTTLAMLLAAQGRGWQIFYLTQTDLYSKQGVSCGLMRELTVEDDPARWFEFGTVSDQPLDTLDVILMRKDPPFNMDYIYSTYLLEQAKQAGTLVVNDPQSLRDCNEKLYATQFPQCCPDFLVSSSKNQLREFHQKHQDVIYKPLDGMGGTSIFRARADDSNLGVIIETLTLGGNRQIMAQKYLPEIEDGDKRILLIDGEPVDFALARIPAIGENRGNLAAGGKGLAQKLSEHDRWICEQLSSSLKTKGLLFVGLDVIGDYLTEINVTSPTCIREIDSAMGTDIGGDLMNCIERKLHVK
ncbi:MAG: glutathione synthase [Gammaproteobacteria bacterium]|nr:glutathione synthase [Gammaproteobacteria bacterium]MCY4356433.1 glutathione synthase [Gammaproteobacteria bacterium]